MENNYAPIAVLGAGLSGLSVGYQLSKNRISVLLIEENSSVGGLSKSIERNGFIFDLGGHRFHTTNKDILKDIKDLLGEDLLLVNRKSRILLHSRFFDYPLRPLSAIFSFGIWNSINISISYISSLFRAKLNNVPEKSFADWVTNRFGKYLYEIYFRPYTQKAWGIPPEQISKDWATERIGLINLWDAFKRALFKSKHAPKTYLSQFYYPRKGIGMIADKMAKIIKDRGNQILTGWKVSEIKWIDNKIESVIIKNSQNFMEVKSDQFISTIPLTEFVSMLRPAVPDLIYKAASNLKYRAIICVFLIINKEKITDDTWIYFPEKEIIFSRNNEPKNWSNETVADKNKTSLCCQIFCNQNDQTWNTENEKLVEKCILDLSKIGFLKEEEIVEHFVERIPYAYPVYRIDYSNQLKIINVFLSQFRNLHLIGRTGTFSYLNMDQVIEIGTEKAKEILYK